MSDEWFQRMNWTAIHFKSQKIQPHDNREKSTWRKTLWYSACKWTLRLACFNYIHNKSQLFNKDTQSLMSLKVIEGLFSLKIFHS